MKIKLDPNDVRFSRMIRERDGKCVFCGQSEKKLECSHFWGRGNKVTRFDARNCDTLCFSCHMLNEGSKQGFYREFKLKQLGEEEYKALERRARSIGKYTKYEKKIVADLLKGQEKNQEHLNPDWIGITLDGTI